MLVSAADGSAAASLCAHSVLARLGSESGDGKDPTASAGWRTEFGNTMVEGVTHPAYRWPLNEVLKIEPALAWRRDAVERTVAEVCPGNLVVTLSAFPLLGCPGRTSPPAEPSPDGEVSRSLLCPDEVVSPHPRYQTFVRNYRVRKGCKVGAFIPRAGLPPEQRLSASDIARLPFDLARRGVRERDPVPGHIYLDGQAFGAAQCCTQVTFLAHNLEDARYLTDQFLVLAPLFLALSAATPFLRGLIADTDTRWDAFQQTWDDRREDELASVRNSRTSPCDLFIGAKLASDEAAARELNDVAVSIHAPAYEELVQAGVDPVLSRHVAHLLVRDPLMVFENKMDVDDAVATDHFEQLQGTNWNNVRFKPPPAGGGIGWRVEFRSPEVQITDFENAAIVAVVRALAQVIMDERWDLAIPISRCDANDVASSCRNAAVDGRFWFRIGGELRQWTLREILAGEGGIFTRCRAWLQRQRDAEQCSVEAQGRLCMYMDLFERRASGALPTPAAWLRSWLEGHPAYRGDGEVPGAFVGDVCRFAAEVNHSAKGAEHLERLRGLLGDLADPATRGRKRTRAETE